MRNVARLRKRLVLEGVWVEIGAHAGREYDWCSSLSPGRFPTSPARDARKPRRSVRGFPPQPRLRLCSPSRRGPQVLAAKDQPREHGNHKAPRCHDHAQTPPGYDRRRQDGTKHNERSTPWREGAPDRFRAGAPSRSEATGKRPPERSLARRPPARKPRSVGCPVCSRTKPTTRSGPGTGSAKPPHYPARASLPEPARPRPACAASVVDTEPVC